MLGKKEVQHIAELARIGMTEEEIEKYQKDLSAVLDYFKKLEEVDTEKVPTLDHIVGQKNVYRQEDRVEDFGEKGKNKILENVPHKKNSQIKVKSVLS